MKLEFFPAAQQEFEEAAGWYESRMPGLGAEFAEELERISGRLLELHSLGEKLDQIHRRISLRRFPFGLIYRVDGEFVRIVAVAHHRRRPSYWRRRAQDR